MYQNTHQTEVRDIINPFYKKIFRVKVMKKMKWLTILCLVFSYVIMLIQPVLASTKTNNGANPILLWSAIGGVALGIIGAITYVNYIKKKRR